MDNIVVLLVVLAGGAVLAGILAFVVLSAIASLVEILPPRFAEGAAAGDALRAPRQRSDAARPRP
jgi:hypothetical protein